MYTMSVFFVALALAFSANHFARSTVAEKSDEMTNTSSMDEERGRQVITLLGNEIPVVMPEPVKQIVETQQKPITLLGQKIWPVPTETPPEKQIKLLGVAIPVSAPVQNPVPDAVAQVAASQGNIRNHFAVDIEKTKQRQSTLELGTPPWQTSSATMTEVGPSSPRGKEVSQGLRGVKRKVSSRDEMIQDAPRKVRTVRAQRQESSHGLEACTQKWGIKTEKVQERYNAFFRDVPFFTHRSKSMATGSIYFELGFPKSTEKGNWHPIKLIEKANTKKNEITSLGLDFDKVKERALFMYRHEPFQPRAQVVVDMAIGMEYYRLLQEKRRFSARAAVAM